MIILGSKFFGHDSAAYIIDTTKRSIFALSTERVTRVKHDDAPISVMKDLFPDGQIDIVAHSFSSFDEVDFCPETKASGALAAMQCFIGKEMDKHPNDQSKTEKLKLNFLEFTSGVKAVAERTAERGGDHMLVHHFAVEDMIRRTMGTERLAPGASIQFFDHHLCHAESAYYSSPYYGQPCLVMTLDGQGDGYFGKSYVFRDVWHQEIGRCPTFPFQIDNSNYVTSLGDLYAEFTAAAGFRRGSDEGKVEALAAFGKPVPEIMQALHDACFIKNNNLYIAPDKIKLYQNNYFLLELIAKIGREDFCATIQTFLQDIVVRYINALSLPEDVDCLCLAGGVAANIIMNLNIWERTRFKKIHVTPYMGDDGTACGAAILAAKLHGEDVSWLPAQVMPYFGPSFSREQVRNVLAKYDAVLHCVDLGDAWQSQAADRVAEGKIIAVFQGKMEFGPRALGNRSILANPADPTIRERINVSIKRRPPWQPFCPSILDTEREKLFAHSFEHKHMAIAFRMLPEYAKLLPSSVHIDGTVRPQFVTSCDNPSYYKLLEQIKRRTGFGVVINTSFNLHGRAMVMTPESAVKDFLDCNLDALFIEGFCVTRR